jgi:multidrug resistance protein, MATE family
VIEAVDSVLWIIIIYVFFDAIHGVQAGIIRGIGRQSAGSVFTLVCYYVFGMPLALACAFKMNLGVAGLWIGFTIASIILDIGFYFIISFTNWDKVAFETSKRLDREEALRQ